MINVSEYFVIDKIKIFLMYAILKRCFDYLMIYSHFKRQNNNVKLNNLSEIRAILVKFNNRFS